jgi:hypothetical protein
MLDVIGSIKNLQWTTEHHFMHIKARHEFMRAIAVQFELAYTDFRTIQLALQLAGEKELLSQFTTQYDAVFQYEMSFTRGGLDEFDKQFPKGIADYDTAQADLINTLNTIMSKQPVAADDADLV